MCFFVNDLLFAVYFIFTLDCRNDIRQKENSSNFLIQIQMCHKAMKTTHNINNAFGPGTANERTVQRWVKKFCQGDKALKMRRVVAGHWKLTTAY